MSKPKGRKNGSFIKHNCLTCKKAFSNHNKATKYCQRDCFYKARRQDRRIRCKICQNIFDRRKPNGRSIQRQFCSRSYATKHTAKIRRPQIRTKKWNQKISEAQKGAKGNNWRGGITPLNKCIRRSPEMKIWREAVFRRDDYRCLDCGERGGILHPDHIYSFAEYPRLRLDINNGRTLCIYCHKRTLTWGTRKGQHRTKVTYYN